VITCCAADAIPMKVALAGGQTGGLANDQWIHADGVLVRGSANEVNEYLPTLSVTSVSAIVQPADPYEY
jgi:uncharacterized membrane protein YcgQ (UPF0703/DUF1980 family)